MSIYGQCTYSDCNVCCCKNVTFRVYSSACQNLAAISKVAIWGDLDKIILPQLWQDNCGNFFVMPKCGNFFVRKKVAISKSCHLGGLIKIFVATIVATYFSLEKVAIWWGLGKIFVAKILATVLSRQNSKKNVTLKGCQIWK